MILYDFYKILTLSRFGSKNNAQGIHLFLMLRAHAMDQELECAPKFGAGQLTMRPGAFRCPSLNPLARLHKLMVEVQSEGHSFGPFLHWWRPLKKVQLADRICWGWSFISWPQEAFPGESQTHVTLGGTKRFSILSEMLTLTKSHFCTPGLSSEEWLVGNCCPHSWCSAHITKHMWKIGEGSGGKWQVGHNRGYSVHIHCFISGGTPRKRPVSISKEAHPFFWTVQEFIKSRLTSSKLIKTPLRRPDLAKEYFDSPTDGFPFYQSHLQARFGRLVGWCGQQLKNWNILERRRTHHLYHPEHTFPPLFGWPFCGELISKRLQKLADSPCYSLVIFVVHEAGREPRGKRAGVEATRTVIQQQKN